MNFEDLTNPHFNIAIKETQNFYNVFYIFKHKNIWYIGDSFYYPFTSFDYVHLLSEYDISDMKLFDVDTFNANITDDKSKKYYDEFGIRILGNMCVFIGDEHGGNGSSICKKSNDYFFDFGTDIEPCLYSLKDLMKRTKAYITSIPKEYIDRIY